MQSPPASPRGRGAVLRRPSLSRLSPAPALTPTPRYSFMMHHHRIHMQIALASFHSTCADGRHHVNLLLVKVTVR